MSRKRSKVSLKYNNSISDVDECSVDEELTSTDQLPYDIEFNIPQQLKLQLENDSFYIQRRNMLIKLPREPNVVTLLTEYYDYCQCRAGQQVVKNLNLLKEVLDGIVTYFDFIILDHLLYGPEKKQYEVVVARQPTAAVVTSAQQTKDDGEVQCCDKVELPSRIYGVEHLLRLFVVLPRFLSRAKISQEHCDELHQYIEDFLGYLCSQTQLFTKDRYEEVLT